MQVHELEVGTKVSCPARRGKKAYNGVVEWVGVKRGVSSGGHEFVWVTVTDPKGKSEHWLSLQLSPRGE